MTIIQFIYPARCRHCHFARAFFLGKRKRTKCMFGAEHKASATSWTYREVEEYQGNIIWLKDKACKNFELC